jgi:threonylcarbamoyladenosine tRNA methylthiotransferase MtaB
MPLRVAFHTLGCKLNQLETESFADAFARGGAAILPFDAARGAAADLVIVNTCTVTQKAERTARRMLRLALAANPDAVVLVTGCYAQVDALALEVLDERMLVLPGSDKASLLGLPAWLSDHARVDDGSEDLPYRVRGWLASVGSDSAHADRFAYNPESFAFHSRPALKIQDGCDNRCAYCRVHIARGPAASLPARDALERVRALEEAGRAEVVLSGVNLSQYRDEGRDFPSLLQYLIAGTDRIAFRLSSYEPDGIDAAFLEAFAHPRLRPHVHLAVQSGADSVLAAMGRRYGRADVLAAVEALRRVRQDPFIAADIISGFPGETEADADATLDLARRCDFTWIHAFHFSPRPGTKAASMPGRVPERIAGERADALLALGVANRARYVERWIGKELKGVLEVGLGFTAENYLKLKLRELPPSAHSGQELICRVEARPGERLNRETSVDNDAFALYIRSAPDRLP